jgi:nucleotide sugar dehydrogenase
MRAHGPVRVAVVGCGNVGATVAACFARVGHQVVGIDVDQHRLRSLRSGLPPFPEPGLGALLESGLASGRLRFAGGITDSLNESEVVFLCVGTPAGTNGRPDLRMLEAAARSVAGAVTDQVVVNKSTIPVGGLRWLASIIRDVPLVSNPEFLREGTAINDFLHPYRIVLGSDDQAALDRVAEVYRPLLEQRQPGAGPDHRPVLIRTSPQTAEMIKFASNAFLATKVSFINEMATICEGVDADVGAVAAGMGLDPRIGAQFLRAGVGWGGSCLHKDLSELIAAAQHGDYEPEVLIAAMAVNLRQRRSIVGKLGEHFRVLAGRRACLLGLAFKPQTDDLRDAPAVEIARQLLAERMEVTAHDPAVGAVPELPGLLVAADAYEAAAEADVTILVTDWPEFRDLDFAELRRRMRGDLFIDGRNDLNAEKMAATGFRYESIGGNHSAAP